MSSVPVGIEASVLDRHERAYVLTSALQFFDLSQSLSDVLY